MTAVQLSKLEAPAVMEGTQNQDTGSIHLICIVRQPISQRRHTKYHQFSYGIKQWHNIQELSFITRISSFGLPCLSPPCQKSSPYQGSRQDSDKARETGREQGRRLSSDPMR
ncbi:unnamed protein product [Somion occarium]|uniref:Uncharacterized protein n=1 Tax=Somion occarium TaxID=3059160 RepID=A0ABP1DFC8_9APHY